MLSNIQGFTLSQAQLPFRDIKLFNSVSNTVESVLFEDPAHPSIYTCGLTVYDHPHLGHLRIMLIIDILTRVLILQGRDVFSIRNTTDIDDKIIQRSIREHTTASEIAKRYTDEMLKVEKTLNLIPLSVRPKATEHVAEMQMLIQKLIDGGHAYVTNRGNVWLHNAAMAHSFGRLSGKRADSLGNSRLTDLLDKKHAGDVALWKSSLEEPHWQSPWGLGRPGWHIECSAMIHKHAGVSLDIHAGGFDLQFPHHEVEWAQSYHATGKELAKFWMHIGFVQIADAKMGKSVGNAISAKKYLDVYGANALRWWIMSSHYRQPLDAQEKTVQAAHNTWMKIASKLENVQASYSAHQEHMLGLVHYLENDLQTPLFLSELNTLLDTSPAAAKYLLESLGFVWGPRVYPSELLEDEQLRKSYKNRQLYKEADVLRSKWLNRGWYLQEKDNGSYWWNRIW